MVILNFPRFWKKNESALGYFNYVFENNSLKGSFLGEGGKEEIEVFETVAEFLTFTETKPWSQMLFTGPYRITKVLAVTSNELNLIFVVDIITWSDWMRTLKYDKEVCKPRDFTISLYLVKRVFATGMQISYSRWTR